MKYLSVGISVAEQRGVTAGLSGGRADSIRVCVAHQPALGPAPVQQPAAGQVQHRRRRGQGDAPQGARAAEEVQLLIPQPLPVVRFRLFAAETGKSVEEIEKDMHRDFWMSAQEAVDYGLLAKVVESSEELD